MAGSTFDTEATSGIDQNDSLSEAVVEAVADAEGVEPTELQPLYDVIDPDALDSLFRPQFDGRHPSRGEITFRYHGYVVHVDDAGRVSLGG